MSISMSTGHPDACSAISIGRLQRAIPLRAEARESHAQRRGGASTAATMRASRPTKVSDGRTAPRPVPWSRSSPVSGRSRESRAAAPAVRGDAPMPAQPITTAADLSSTAEARPDLNHFASVPSPDAVSATLMLNGRLPGQAVHQPHLPEIAGHGGRSDAARSQ